MATRRPEGRSPNLDRGANLDRSVVAALRAYPRAPLPPGFTTRTMARVAATAQLPAAGTRLRVARRRWLDPAPVLVGAVATFGLAWALWWPWHTADPLWSARLALRLRLAWLSLATWWASASQGVALEQGAVLLLAPLLSVALVLSGLLWFGRPRPRVTPTAS